MKLHNFLVSRTTLAIFAVACIALAVFGCGGLFGPAKSPQLTAFECQLEAFEAVVPRPVAEDLVMAARAGNIQYLVSQLLRLGVAEGRIEALADAFGACERASAPPAPPPAPPELIRS